MEYPVLFFIDAIHIRDYIVLRVWFAYGEFIYGFLYGGINAMSMDNRLDYMIFHTAT